MPQLIDGSRSTGPSHRRRWVLLFAALVLALFLSARTLLSYWLDLLWFRSLGYGEVFWKTNGLQAAVFALSTLLTFAVLYGAFTALRRIHRFGLPATHAIVVNGQNLNISVGPMLRWGSLAIAIFLALITGFSMAGNWQTVALFLYAPHGMTGIVDPIFGRPLTFFLFTLPAWQLFNDWLRTLSITICIAAAALILLSGGFRALEKQRSAFAPSPWRGISFALSFLLLAIASNVYVSRFSQILEHHTIFDGATYTDVHITLNGLLLVCAALLLGAVLAALNGAREARRSQLILAVLPAVACYVLVALVGWYTASFIVKPNELDRERPYIAHNIEMTRRAFGLDRFQQREFPAEITVDATDPADNQATLQNIRLWDWHALQDTLRQVQEIRTYYDFPDIDIDRYSLNGTTREVMLAERELDINKLPESSRNWINEKLIYTHGYGVTMNSVNGFTPEGLPVLMLSNMPVQSTVPGLSVTRPEIYFGEFTNTDVYVKTGQKEFDYPQGQDNTLTSYQGDGGIVVGSFLRRLGLAVARDDLGKLPFSDDVNAQSRLLLRRNIRERVATIAPFLTYDRDPYMVVGDDGRLSWIIDAVTTSDSYPYSTHYALGDGSVNYLRNSVKVVVDAYNGTTTFYVFDPADPVLAAYRRFLPALFKDASAMPSDLRRHIRYPELLFNLQSAAYGLYHMTDPDVFFNREDLWTVATETTLDAMGQQSVQSMKPNFVLMKLPGETDAEFIEILPFTPANRNNLIGWIAARCDGANYGSAIVYDFPKGRLVDGPQQIEARIDQNAQLSGQLTLWNQQGSHVLRGSLLVIPSGRALLYAEPIYLQAQQSPMPELRLVVLALQDKLAYGPTFQAALSSLYAGQTSSLTATEAEPGPPALPRPLTNARPDTTSLIAQAGKAFDDYQRLTAAGKLAEAGQRLDDLKRILNQLNAPAK